MLVVIHSKKPVETTDTKSSITIMNARVSRALKIGILLLALKKQALGKFTCGKSKAIRSTNKTADRTNWRHNWEAWRSTLKPYSFLSVLMGCHAMNRGARKWSKKSQDRKNKSQVSNSQHRRPHIYLRRLSAPRVHFSCDTVIVAHDTQWYGSRIRLSEHD